MCGIAACISTDLSIKKKFTSDSIKLLSHRGPDDSGIYEDENLALVHTRLSIQDLSPMGHQPMVSKNERFVIIFNGEIYNHLELRKQLLPEVFFNSNNDTATILELFSKLGENMLGHLVGMWAMMIHDKEKNELFISRDRFGQKPLYYLMVDDSLFFASEMKCLFPFSNKISLNNNMIGEFLGMGNYAHLGDQTFYQEITHFPASSYAKLSLNKSINSFEIVNYWKLPRIGKIQFGEENLLELRERVIEAVLSQTISDRPIGITLSGGLDSSIIASVLLNFHKGHIHIFTAQTDDKQFSEKKYVDALLNQYDSSKFTLHEINLDEELKIDMVVEALKCQEEPFGDPSIVAHMMIMKKAKELEIPVIINGQGADELFWGYNNLVLALLAKDISKLKFQSFKIWRKFFGKKDLFRVLLLAFFPALEKVLRQKQRKSQKAILPEVWRGANLIKTIDYSDLNQVWNDTAFGIHLPHLVHYDDRNAMHYGIEGRSPFLDHRLWEFVAKFNPSMHLYKGFRKGWLREAFKDLLPSEIYERRTKIGFFTPLKKFCEENYSQMLEIQQPLIEKFGVGIINKNELTSPMKNRFFFRLTLVSFIFVLLLKEKN
ncbi:MAG: asparagine synthase (glutamine-hydrolyzing) [Cytophagales bacterium]